MVELTELFEQREKMMDEHTDKIFKSMPNVLDGCREFVFSKQGGEPNIEWENAFFVKEDNIVMIMASIGYDVGDTIQLETGEMITFTEETAPYFKAMLRIGIPINLATSGTVKEIFDFLSETVEHSEENSDIHPQSIDFSGEANQDSGFNLEDLTEEQRQAMELFIASETMKDTEG